jgi:Ion channel
VSLVRDPGTRATANVRDGGDSVNVRKNPVRGPYRPISTYTTVGFGDVVLGPGWRVLAGIEGLTGLMLVGWSTAFVFAIVNRMYEHWRPVHEVS